MKVSTTNDNGRSTFARNLMAPILFYPKVDSSSGLNDEKSSECDWNAMVHEVCYDPTNMDSQMYKIYLNPFNTGSMEQWLKFLTKLNLIITGNGLMAGPVKFNLMWLLPAHYEMVASYQRFGPTIKYIKGPKNIVANVLSRLNLVSLPSNIQDMVDCYGLNKDDLPGNVLFQSPTNLSIMSKTKIKLFLLPSNKV